MENKELLNDKPLSPQSTVGERLTMLRTRANMSKTQLAKTLDVSVSTICDYDNDVCLPDIHRIAALSALLNASMNMILFGSDESIDAQEENLAIL